MTWFRYAACRGMAVRLFFPEPGEPNHSAKTVCRQCPVNRECLDHALSNRELHGIWGGTTNAERRAMRNRRKAAA